MTIVGAGAVGSYYGALLARDGHDVTMVARGGRLEALASRGHVTVVEADGERWTAPVLAAAEPGDPADLVVVATKSHHTAEVAALAARAVAPDGALLSLQNGVENVALLDRAAGAGRALAGLAFVGLWIPEPGVVIHGAEGAVSVGDPAGGATPRARRLHRLLAPSWDVTLSEDIVLDQWRKLLWNAGFNALCAVTGATAGEALSVPDSRALVREAMDEVVAIAERHSIELGDADVAEMAADNEQLRDYRPSTARDLDEAKRVEREALCGFVVREGRRLGVDVPVNRVLDGLLALQEARSRAAALPVA